MSDVTVRPLGEEDWDTYRQIRLAALKESPDVFVSTYAEEDGFDEDFWRLRMRRSVRLLAERDDQAVGVVSVGEAKPFGDELEAAPGSDIAEIFGMWVDPEARGTGVAWRLVDAAAAKARRAGHSHLMRSTAATASARPTPGGRCAPTSRRPRWRWCCPCATTRARSRTPRVTRPGWLRRGRSP